MANKNTQKTLDNLTEEEKREIFIQSAIELIKNPEGHSNKKSINIVNSMLDNQLIHIDDENGGRMSLLRIACDYNPDFISFLIERGSNIQKTTYDIFEKKEKTLINYIKDKSKQGSLNHIKSFEIINSLKDRKIIEENLSKEKTRIKSKSL